VSCCAKQRHNVSSLAERRPPSKELGQLPHFPSQRDKIAHIGFEQPLSLLGLRPISSDSTPLVAERVELLTAHHV
jgi:hypothetical protein